MNTSSSPSAINIAGFVGALGIASIVAIPTAAPSGDNVASRSARTPWYQGPTLFDALEVGPGRRPAAGRAVPLSGAVGQPPQPGFSRIRRADRRAAPSRPATRCACCRRDARPPSPASSPGMVICRGRRRPVGDAHPDRGSGCQPRRRDLVGGRSRRRRRSVRSHGDLDGRSADAARPALSASRSARPRSAGRWST